MDILFAQRDNGSEHFPLVLKLGSIAKGILSCFSLREGRFDFGLDHLGNESNCVKVKRFKRASRKSFSSQEEGFSQSNIIDPAHIVSLLHPVEVGGISAGYQLERDAVAFFIHICQAGEFIHVVSGRLDPIQASEICSQGQ